MKTTRERRDKASDAPAKHKWGTQVSKSTNKSSGQHSRPAGKESEGFLCQEENVSSPFGSDPAIHPQPTDKCIQSAELAKRLPMPEHCLERDLHSSAKMKLQLFPADNRTRTGLEKDGYHPYLELTLSSRKRISSVIRHLKGKWGGSSMAVGDPVLFPYNISKDLGSQRWSLNDTDSSAGDVYAAIGSPSVFRLRYGWISEPESESSFIPSTSTPPLEACLQSSFIPSTSTPPLEACLQHKGTEKDCIVNVETAYDDGEKIETINEEIQPSIASGASVPVWDDKMPSGGLVEHMDTEEMPDAGIGQSSALWDDSITNISIGGLLSDTLSQGRFNTFASKSNGIGGGLPTSQLITDSLDAFIAANISHSQAPRPPPHGSISSILDAEDTCHGFPVQKLSTLSNEASALSGSSYTQACNQEAGSFKHANMTEVNVQSGLPQGSSCQGSQTDLLLCSRVYNDESSLGLSGIKWTESLGPFDLGLSSSRKIISGDSLSISKIFG